jgi:flagellar biosynthesis component FlhA
LPDTAVLSQGLENVRGRVFESWGIVLVRPGVGVLEHNLDGYRIAVRGIDVLERTAPQEGDLWPFVLGELERVVEQCRVEILDDAGTRRALDYVERQAPDLVSSVVPQIVSLTQMTAILRQLLVEGITIRHLDVVLQTIAENGNRAGVRALVAEIRVALKQVVSRRASYNGKIKAITLDPLIDLVLVRGEDGGGLISMELVDVITEAVKEHDTEGLVVVASKRARGYLRDLLGAKGMSVPVIAHEEIVSSYVLQIVGAIEPRQDSERAALVEELTA